MIATLTTMMDFDPQVGGGKNFARPMDRVDGATRTERPCVTMVNDVVLLPRVGTCVSGDRYWISLGTHNMYNTHAGRR